MQHARCHFGLSVGAHHYAQEKDDQGRERIHREAVRLGLLELGSLLVGVRALRKFMGRLGHRHVQEVTDVSRLDEHTALDGRSRRSANQKVPLRWAEEPP